VRGRRACLWTGCASLLLTGGATGVRSAGPERAAATAINPGCFEKATTARARRSATAARPAFAIGDSVMVYSVAPLGRAGFDADARPCRAFKDAQRMIALKARHRTLPAVVVIALGANGPFTLKDIQRVLRIIGPGRHLALLTARFSGDRPGYGAEAIHTAGRIYARRVRVLDWVARSTGHPDWFAPDGVHLASPAGIQAYTDLIRSARRRGDDAPPKPSSSPAPAAHRSAEGAGVNAHRSAEGRGG
jgi:hypothetical protein